jgi:hypothetical protein
MAFDDEFGLVGRLSPVEQLDSDEHSSIVSA